MKYITFLLLCLCLCSCAKLEVSAPDGTRAYYSRHIFGQEIHGLKIMKDVNGTIEVELESQKSDAAVVADITKSLIPVIDKYQTMTAISNAALLPLSLGK